MLIPSLWRGNKKPSLSHVRSTEADTLRQRFLTSHVWQTHSNEGGTSGRRSALAPSNQTPVSRTAHLNYQENLVRRQMTGVKDNSRRCSFQLPDRCRHLKGSILSTMAWKGESFQSNLKFHIFKIGVQLNRKTDARQGREAICREMNLQIIGLCMLCILCGYDIVSR